MRRVITGFAFFMMLAACAGSHGTSTRRLGADGGPSPDGGATGCAIGATMCEPGCVDLRTDPDNCGGCAQACAPGELCGDGACGADCPVGQTDCGGRCTDTSIDPANCGGCGIACTGAGALCSEGTCATSCSAGLTECAGSCRDLSTDRANCGACGNACAAGEICEGGACALSCVAGLTPCGGSCRDLSTDNANCGACGNGCPAGDTCTGGSCVLVCGSGLTPCSGVCRDLSSDNASCGACGNACDAGEMCSSGVCQVTCGAGLTNCGGSCVDLSSSPTNCGACGATCGGGEACVSGGCMPVATSTDYHVGGTGSSFTQTMYLRGNVIHVTTAGQLMRFQQRIDRSGSCNLDFYVHSSSGATGSGLTVEWSRQVSVGAGTGYVSSGPIDLSLTPGLYYYLSVAWNCTTTSHLDYLTSWIGFDVGVGTLYGWTSTNSYPGYSTGFTGPLMTYTSGAYDQIITVRM